MKSLISHVSPLCVPAFVLWLLLHQKVHLMSLLSQADKNVVVVYGIIPTASSEEN
jgi:hypothetical protein